MEIRGLLGFPIVKDPVREEEGSPKEALGGNEVTSSIYLYFFVIGSTARSLGFSCWTKRRVAGGSTKYSS